MVHDILVFLLNKDNNNCNKDIFIEIPNIIKHTTPNNRSPSELLAILDVVIFKCKFPENVYLPCLPFNRIPYIFIKYNTIVFLFLLTILLRLLYNIIVSLSSKMGAQIT